jgi:hypothetical protein
MPAKSSTTTPNKRVSKKPVTHRVSKKVPGQKPALLLPSRHIITHALSLVALSPYRFPLDVEKLAVSTARVGGFAVLFLGLVFTYKYIESTTSGYIADAIQTANVAAVACAQGCPVEKTPPVSFGYQETMTGTIVTVSVPHVEKVRLYAFHTETGEYERVGDAVQVGADDWQYQIPQGTFTSGTYWMKALVTNEYGTYDRSDDAYLTLP